MRVPVVTRRPKQRLLLTEDTSTLPVLTARAQVLRNSMVPMAHHVLPMNKKWALTLHVGDPKSYSWVTLHCYSKKRIPGLRLPSFCVARKTTQRKGSSNSLATLRGNHPTRKELRAMEDCTVTWPVMQGLRGRHRRLHAPAACPPHSPQQSGPGDSPARFWLESSCSAPKPCP